MDNAAVTEHLKLAPIEMRETLAGFKTDLHWAMYIYFLERPEEKTTRSDVMGVFDISVDTFERVRSDLSNAGLVSQYAARISDLSEGNTYFKVTVLGIVLYGTLFNLFIPKRPKKTKVKNDT